MLIGYDCVRREACADSTAAQSASRALDLLKSRTMPFTVGRQKGQGPGVAGRTDELQAKVKSRKRT